jgi:uncharacterized membrane protein
MNGIISFLDGFLISILLILWSYTLLNFNKLPKIIPIHFGFDGMPDNFGSKYFIFLLPILALLLYFFLGYNVKEINNYPVEITKENKDAQLVIGILAVKTIIAYVLFIFFISKTYRKHFSQKNRKINSNVKTYFGLIFHYWFFLDCCKYL